jgi:hypothetical protein
VLFAGGYVEFVRAEGVSNLRWDVNEVTIELKASVEQSPGELVEWLVNDE